MVIDQGSMLDRIDYNVERMAVDVKAADKELTVATGYQRRSIKRKVILLLLILVAGMFILLSLKLSRKEGSSPPPAPPVPEIPGSPPAPPQFADRGTLSARVVLLRPSKDWHRRKRRLWQGMKEDVIAL
jgi:syntaxin 16